MLYTYSVTPLKDDHFDERCADIVSLVKNKTVYMPLFQMTLIPEGNPVWDKASKMAELYGRYRDELQKHGVQCGILVQASLGHGYEITRNPFQPKVGLFDGEESYCCCPGDEAFIRHFCGVLKTLAMQHPAALMLDDDFRMMLSVNRGCACPLCMQEFHRRSGTSVTREELAEHIQTHPEDDAWSQIFRDIQHERLVHAAETFREAVDSVDPTIQGINCTSGHICESVSDTNKIWAGKGNPTMVRIPNGTYAPNTVREFSDVMRNAAICGSKLKKHGIEIILAETDTIPFQRYGKSARYLHAQYTASLLEGAKGAKHWITRNRAFEPEAGAAYRKILTEHYGFYEKVAQLADEIHWTGINGFFVEQEKVLFHKEKAWRYHTCNWISKSIERLGLPFYFMETNQGLAVVEGDMIADMTDAQIEKLFSGSVMLDGESAQALTERGYGKYLGIAVSEWKNGHVSGEVFAGKIGAACEKQKNIHQIQICDPAVRTLSYNFREELGTQHRLAPASTLYRREDGKISVVFCGSPDVEFTYYEGFSFLNQNRKEQFLAIMKEANVLPIYCCTDNEVCLRAGYLQDERLLAALYLLGTDPMEEVVLYLEKKPKKITVLQKDGTEEEVSWERIDSDKYRIAVRTEQLNPVVFIIA